MLQSNNGGTEAEAAMLGQPITMLIPDVVGVRLSGRLNEGVTATDLVLTVVRTLRAEGVVGKFVEFFGPGLDELTIADRATVANMAPRLRPIQDICWSEKAPFLVVMITLLRC